MISRVEKEEYFLIFLMDIYHMSSCLMIERLTNSQIQRLQGDLYLRKQSPAPVAFALIQPVGQHPGVL